LAKYTSEESQTLRKLNASFKTLVFQLSKNEVELSDKVKELRDFAHVIAHDLHSPLATAYSYQLLIQEKLKNGTFDKSSDLEYVDIVAKKLLSSMALIDEMLHYAENGGKVSLDKEFSIHDVISLALSNLSEHIQKTKAIISIHIDHFMLKGSSSLLASAITNLLTNSLKYTKKGVSPVVEMTAGINDKNIPYLIINDNGIGIPNDKLNTIFDEFVRLDQSKNEKGSGIGLTTVKRILQAHNAEIVVSSDINKGTSFTISFDTLESNDLQTTK
jgi:signal transduction histidine kinase